MNTIEVMSKQMIDDIRPDPDKVLISIKSSIYPRTKNVKGWKNVYLFTFDDVTERPGKSVIFSEGHSSAFLTWFEKYGIGNDIIVQCDAGMSRSVAIGRFVSDMYEYEPIYHVTKSDRHANIHVYNTLRRTLFQTNGTLQDDETA